MGPRRSQGLRVWGHSCAPWPGVPHRLSVGAIERVHTWSPHRAVGVALVLRGLACHIDRPCEVAWVWPGVPCGLECHCDRVCHLRCGLGVPRWPGVPVPLSSVVGSGVCCGVDVSIGFSGRCCLRVVAPAIADGVFGPCFSIHWPGYSVSEDACISSVLLLAH